LFSTTFIDELISSVPVLSLPLMRTDLGLSYTQVGWLFSIAGLAAMLVEPGINAVSDQWPKRRLILSSLLGLAAGMALAGSSTTYAILLGAFALIGATNGTVLGMSQAILIDQNPDDSLRTMTRWTFMAALGDLAGPALIAAAFAVGMGWRQLFWASALLWLAALAALSNQRLPTTPSAAGEDGEFNWRTIRGNIALALRTPNLLRWLLLTLLPSLLDELFMAFAALFMQDRLLMTPSSISVALGIHVAGGLLGLVLIDRFGDRFQPQRLLGGLALVVLAGLLIFVFSSTGWIAVVALALIGVGASGWYPIAKAEAYRALPGRSGTVRAVYSLGIPLEIVAPLVVGAAAQRWGIQAGVALLMVAPVAVLLFRPRPVTQ
jgi:predicted MFS family arabinose efflux permease